MRPFFVVPKIGLVSRPKAAEQRSLAECGEEGAEGEEGRPDRVTNSASGRSAELTYIKDGRVNT